MKPLNPRVEAVEVRSNTSLWITFQNGEIKNFDMQPYLKFPVFQKLLNPTLFRRARVEYGTVVWDENTDMSPDTLYLGGQSVETSTNSIE